MHVRQRPPWNDLSDPRSVITMKGSTGVRRSAGPLLLWLALVSASCNTARPARRLMEQYPNSQFEVLLIGCVTPGESAQNFGSDAKMAILWSRERVKGARYFPCTALIRAVGPRDTTAVYRISFARNGGYDERPLLPTPIR